MSFRLRGAIQVFKFRINTNEKSASQSDILIEIERLVSYILKNQHNIIMGNKCTAKNNSFDEEFYKGFCEAWPKYVSVYSSMHDYSELIEAFWRACEDSIPMVFQKQYVNTNHQICHFTFDQVMAIVSSTVRHIQDRDIKRKSYDRSFSVKKNQATLDTFVRMLIQKYRKLLVVRVDYAYSDETMNLIGIDELYRDLESLNKDKHTHASFKNLVGNAWAIEQGERKGYHIHAVYFFDGNKSNRDMYFAKQFGQLWKSITKGMGYYYNCNADKMIHAEKGTLGIGMILSHDRESCENAIKAIGYLADPTKEFQYLRMKPCGRKTFATGMTVKTRKKIIRK